MISWTESGRGTEGSAAPNPTIPMGYEFTAFAPEKRHRIYIYILNLYTFGELENKTKQNKTEKTEVQTTKGKQDLALPPML